MSEAHKGYKMPQEQKNKISMVMILKREQLDNSHIIREKKNNYQRARYEKNRAEILEKRRMYMLSVRADEEKFRRYKESQKKSTANRKEKTRIRNA